MELSIDTSTKYSSIGISVEGKVVREYAWFSKQNHSVELLPSVESLLSISGMGVRDIDCVIVAIGPGGFSSLRVGLSTAKALAAAINVPIIGLNTLDIEAYPFKDVGMPVCSLMDMGRGELAGALYSAEQGSWIKIEKEQVMAPGDLCSSIKDPTLFSGEGVPSFASVLVEYLGKNAVLADQSLPTRSPATLAVMGYQRFQRSEYDDVYSLEPLYLRRPSITTTARR